MPSHGRLLLLFLLCLLAVTAAPARADAAACTINWATDASGAYSNAANWDLGRVPNGADDVCIDRGAANPTITIASTDHAAREFTSAERLTITGGGLTINQASTISGPVDLTGGFLVANAAVTLAGTTTLGAASTSGFGSLVNTGTFTVPSDGTLGVPTRNDGTLRVTTGTLTLNQVLTNAATIDLAGDGDITGGATLVNNGTIRKSAGVMASVLSPARVDGTTPTFDAQTGTLTVSAPANWTGGATLTAATGATVRAQSPAATTATLAFSGTLTATGNVEVAGMNVTNLSDALPANLTGAIRAANVSLYGSGAELVNKGALTLTGPAGFGNRFVNDTTGIVTQQAAIGFGGLVTSRGTWIVDGDHALTQNGNGRFQQDGTLRKASGTGTTTLDGQFDGTAPTFDVRTGTMLLRNPSSWTGGARIDTAANAIFRFQRDAECCWAMNISGTFTGTGSGRVEFVNGNLGGAATINFPAGVFHVTGGNVYGHTNAGTLTISNASVHGGFSNTGTLRQVGDTGYDGNVSNTGQWDIQGDYTLARNANGTLRNDGGTFRKSSGTGLSYLDRIDGTHPTFDVDTGTLVLRESSTWTSGAQIDAATGAIFRLQRGSECCWAMEASGTLTGTGGGRFEMVNGSLRAGALPLTLDFPASYFHVSGGGLSILTNAGELTIGNTGINNVANTGSVRQTGDVSFTGTNPNSALWDMQGNPTLANGGNGRFVNDGTIRRSSGTGTATLNGRIDGSHPTFDVRTGVLLLRDQSTWTNGAQIDTAAGATFRFQRDQECCWSMTASGTLTGSGAGRVELVNGNLFGGAQPLTLNFPAGYFHSTGRIYGLTNSGEITLAGGSVHGGLVNSGTIRQTADTTFDGAVSNSGIWDITGDFAFAQAANGSFSNTGTIRKSAGAGTSILNGTFNGTHPTFDVDAGTLQLGTNSTWTDGAQIDAATGATFRIFKENECCFAIRASGTLTGTGGGRFVLDSGDFGGGGTLNFQPGYFHARGGALRDTTNTASMTLTGTHITSNFVNQGTIEQTGNSAGGYSSNVVNDGTWILSGDSGLFSTANNNFRNNGTVRRTGGTTVVTIRGNFDNRGTVEARSGALAIEESLQLSNGRNLNGGNWVVADGAVMTFPTLFGIENNAATITINGRGTLPELSGPQTSLRRNTGTLALVQGATVNLPASLTNAGTLNLGRSSRLNVDGAFIQEAAGTLATTIDGRPATGAYGALDADGAATLNGTLAVATGPGFSAVNGDRFGVLGSTSRSGQFAQYTGLPISAAVAFKPDTREDGVSLRVAAIGDTRSALRVTNVNVTPATTLFPGVDATVDYTVANDGDPTTAGTWTDSIYLSSDGAYDPSDALVGRVTHSGNVGRDGTYTGTLTTPLPGVVPGDYRFVVVPDSRGANAAAAPGEGARASVPRTVDVQQLPLSTPINATVLANRTRYYRLPAGTDPLQIDAAFGVSGRARVLARTGAMPDTGNYEQGSDGEGAPRLLVPSPGDQPVYIAVVGLNGGSFTLTAGPVAFALSEVSPARANAVGQTTVTIIGAGFTDAAQVELVGASSRNATKVSFTDQRVIHATFNLAGATPGAYAVKVTDGARTATLPGAFTVNASQEGGKLVLSTQAPPTFRIGFGGFFSVTYRNTGGSDVPMPLLRVTANKATAWAVTSIGASGLTSTAFYNTRQPGVIPPGGSVSVPIRFQDSGVTAHEIVRFKTSLILPDDTPMDWTSRKAGLRPAGTTPASWDKIWPTFLTIVGPTKKSYMAALTDAAGRAAASGRALAGEGDMLLALRERAIARAPGAPLRGTLLIAGQPGAGKTLTAFDADGRGGTVRTDDDGAFSIWDIPAGTYTLTLRGRETEPWGSVTVPAGAIAMSLPGATQIAGVARDVRGKPVAGARVEGRDGRRLYFATTDKQGRFMLDEVLPGTVSVRVLPVNAAAPAAQSVVVNGATPPAGLTFTIGQGAVVQGTIKRADGSAAAGATVTVGSEKAETDAAGNYLIDSLDGGTYVIAASAENAGAVSKVVTVADNGSGTADLTLDAEGRVNGTITSGGQPLEGATVVLLDPGARHDPIITGAGGTYTLRGLSRGEHQLLFTAAGYGSAARTVDLDPGDEATLAVALSPKGRITGLAAPGANVYLRGDAHPPAAVTADSSGEFEFEDLPAGRYALGLDTALTVARQVVQLDGNANVDLRTTAVSLSGTTRDAAGAAAGGVRVTLLRGADEIDRKVSGTNGSYSFRIAAAGTYTVRADRVGYGVGTSTPRVVGSSDVTGVDIQPGTATLSVRVRNAAGTLTPGVNVTAGSQRAETGADGIARFPGLPAGSYTVSALGASEVASGLTANLAAGGTTFDVQTAAPATLQGTIRDANGQPLRGVHVLATTATGSTSMVLTGADGRYSFTRLKPGAYEVSYADGRRRATTRSLVIPAALDVTLATVATPLSVTTDGAARALLEVRRGALYAPVLLGAADGLTGKVALGGLEGSQEYRLTLAADGRPAISTTFTTDPTGAPSGLPATLALGTLSALPADIYASSAAKKAKQAAPAPDLPPMYEDFADTIFKAFDIAGNQLDGPKQAEFDKALWRTSWVFFASDSCDPDLEADLKAAEQASNAIEKAFRDWQIVAEQGRENRAEDMVKLTAAATQMAAQVTLLLSGIGALEAAAASVPATSLTAMERALLDGAGNLAQSLSTAINDLRSGSGLVGGWSSWVDHITGSLGAVMTLAAEDPAALGDAAWKSTMGVSSAALGFVDTIKAAMFDIQNLRDAVDDNVAMTLGDYLQAQQRYLDALKKYKAALDRLRHYQAPDGEECPDPPPPVPVITIDLTSEDPGIEGLLSDDPNDITGPAGAGAGHWLREGDPLEYTIRFENKATASLPARKVIITHVLDADADLSTFQLGSAGFNEHLVTAPAKRQSWRTTIDDAEDSGTVVEVDARLNAATRTATWTFTALDETTGDEPANPLTGFLPPAIDPPNGGGFATYSVKSMSGARTVDAQARIVFDANPAIDTNVYSNGFDVAPPSSSVAALPATTTATSFPVSWSGTDAGSGVASYDVLVSVDGGAFTPWQTGTAATSGTYPGAVGHSYAFYSVATDAVGFVEAAAGAAQAQTSVVAPVVIGPPIPGPPLVQPPIAAPFKPALTVVRKGTGKYEIRIKNGGTKTDRFKLKLAKRSGYTLKVMAGRKNVTKLVLKGTYRTASVAAGKTLTLKLTIRGKKKVAFKLTATSVGSPSARSTATARFPR